MSLFDYIDAHPLLTILYMTLLVVMLASFKPVEIVVNRNAADKRDEDA